MRVNPKRLSLYAMLVLGVFAAGFVIGARTGAQQFLYADAQYKASVVAGTVKALKAGRGETLVPSMEITLDGEIENHGRYMESNFKWLFPELKSPDDLPIKRAVAYRTANPFAGPDLSKPESWNPGVRMDDPFVLETVRGQVEGRLYMEKVLKTYGANSHNLSANPDAPKAARRLP